MMGNILYPMYYSKDGKWFMKRVFPTAGGARKMGKDMVRFGYADAYRVYSLKVSDAPQTLVEEGK